MYPDIGMGASTLIGFVNSSISSSTVAQPPASVCPTGNCTWPLYSSLGVCSIYVDVSSQVSRTFDYGTPEICIPEPVVMSGNYTNYSLPYGHSDVVVQGYNRMFNDSRDCSDIRSSKRQVGLGIVLQPNETYSFQKWDTLLASFAVLRPPDDYYNNEVAFENAKVTAIECAL